MVSLFKAAIPYVLAISCMTMYAYIIVALKTLMSKYNIVAVMALYLPIQLAVTLVVLAAMSGFYYRIGWTVIYPLWSDWRFILGLGVLYAVAQTLNNSVYASGGTAVMMSYMTLLIPILTPMLAYYVNGEALNRWHVYAFVAALVMMVCIIKGGMIQKAEKAEAQALAQASTLAPSQ